MIGRVKYMPIADPKRARQRPQITIEETGRGKCLCYDYMFGRLFRDDPDTLKDICERFCDIYNETCDKLDDDPEHTSFEATSYNELYRMIPIEETGIGNMFVYSNEKEYRTYLEFHYEMVTSGPMVDRFGEPIFFFGPKEGCEPMEIEKEEDDKEHEFNKY